MKHHLSRVWHKKKPLETNVSNGKQASQEGFEPPTVRLEGGCSIRLSYYDNSATNNIIGNSFLKVNEFLLFIIPTKRKIQSFFELSHFEPMHYVGYPLL